MKRSGSRGLVLLARITKTQGLRGELRARPASGESENLSKLKKIFVRSKSGEDCPFAVDASRPGKSFHIVKLHGVDCVDEAQSLVGCDILAASDDVATLPEGEFYWFELVGLRVFAHDGRELGAVSGLFPTGANDVLVVSEGKTERFIPYTDDAIARIDLDEGIIVLTDQEGLEEL